jgi:PPE-repeat protein
MYGYSTASAAAATLAPFTQPKQTTDPAGPAAQSTAVAQAAASIPNGLQRLAAGSVPQWLQNFWTNIGKLLADPNFGIDANIWSDVASSGVFQLPATLNIAGFAGQSTLDANTIAEGFAKPVVELGKALGGLIPSGLTKGATTTSALSGGGGGVSAVLAGAKSIGPLSVPASWSNPAVSHISPLSGAGLTTLPGTDEAVGSGVPGVPGMPAGTVVRASGVLPRYGVRLTVMPRPPAAG